ncbi:PP1 [Symbiodinium natans]|uniref:PP1 protein n=1 Tax=Symbiodinium natans TaxID=878477 RepID=A0A812RJN4_9DINO|nr:PP1 [Symbiodinium natans]
MELEAIVDQLATPGKGITATDEGAGTIGNRFEAVGIENTEENRRIYRQMLYQTDGVERYLSGAILDPETVYQKNDAGVLFPEALSLSGIVPGVKPHLKAPSRSSEDEHQVTVLSLSGGEIAKLIATPQTSIQEMKEELSTKTGLSVMLQALTYQDQALNDSQTCQQLGWTGPVSVYMVAKSVDFDGRIALLREDKAGLKETEIREVCALAQDIFMKQPVLLELQPPLVVCGTTSSCIDQLNEIITRCGEPGPAKYLFLGNYVSKGRTRSAVEKSGIDLVILLYCYMCKHPDQVFLLRGRQECSSLSRIYGFYDECKRRYNVKLWKRVVETMNCMPLCALIQSRIFCVSSGLSPELRTLDQINEIARPTDVPDHGLICDLLWSSPETDVNGWTEMDKGVSYCFGQDIVENFLKQNQLDMICRSGQVCEAGYEYFADQKLVTVFSCAKYCGEFDNAGAAARPFQTADTTQHHNQNVIAIHNSHHCYDYPRDHMNPKTGIMYTFSTCVPTHVYGP